MKARLQDRLAAGLSVALLVGLAAGTYYFAQKSLRDTGIAAARPPAGEPDYFVEGAVFTRFDARGEPAFRVSARRIEHFPDDRVAAYEEPQMVSLDPARPRVELRAERGRSTDDLAETMLAGKVVMVRGASPSEPALTIRSERVTVHHETGVARTDQPVRVERGASVLTGVGMEFNNAARSLRVDSRVRLTWQPPPPPR